MNQSLPERKVIAVLCDDPEYRKALALRFGLSGYAVALVDRDESVLPAECHDLRGAGVEAVPFVADLSDPSDADQVLHQIVDRLGRIDLLEYAIVGRAAERPTFTALPGGWRGGIADLYLHTPIALVRTVLPHMIARGGGDILLVLDETFEANERRAPADPALRTRDLRDAAERWIIQLQHELRQTAISISLLSDDRDGSTGSDHAGGAIPGGASVHPLVARRASLRATVLAERSWQAINERGSG